MNIKSLFAAAALCMLPLLSQAGVIYEWRAVNDATPRGLTLHLEFEKKAVKSGSFSFHLNNEEMEFGWPRPDLGLIAFHLTFPQEGGMDFDRDYGYAPYVNVGYLDIEVDFDKKGFMHGSISAMNFETMFSMSSEDGVFTVHDIDSDYPTFEAGCDWYSDEPCSGAMGTIRRVDVPEPASLALLGLGAAALVSTRRRKVVK